MIYSLITRTSYHQLDPTPQIVVGPYAKVCLPLLRECNPRDLITDYRHVKVYERLTEWKCRGMYKYASAEFIFLLSHFYRWFHPQWVGAFFFLICIFICWGESQPAGWVLRPQFDLLAAEQLRRSILRSGGFAQGHSSSLEGGATFSTLRHTFDRLQVKDISKADSKKTSTLIIFFLFEKAK